ncbi:hypothetical protein [Companilactobacillus furfuricola]|uniref:hypothetical protein n=1 Tax=Companilactobacillus furfuricola TaxID=1462575 RepID=UPI0013DDBAE7|nr:hypothetical protein [Companilactobacillus furfuricola]
MKRNKMFLIGFFTVLVLGWVLNYVPYIQHLNWILKLVIIVVIAQIFGFVAEKFFAKN